MGCCTAKPINNKQNTQQYHTQYKKHTSTKKVKSQKQSYQKNQVQEEPRMDSFNSKLEAGGKDQGSHSTTMSNKTAIQRYSVQARQSASYKTPSIHSYQYQCLLEFNPSKYAQCQTDRFSLEKTLLHHNLSNKEIPIDHHNKLLLTKN